MTSKLGFRLPRSIPPSYVKSISDSNARTIVPMTIVDAAGRRMHGGTHGAQRRDAKATDKENAVCLSVILDAQPRSSLLLQIISLLYIVLFNQ
jgi:hypothetical protein